MARNNIRVGYPGLTFELPAPSTGMNFGNNSDIEVTELDSGGRFVYSKATTYKTFNMSWRSVTPSMQPLLDMYNKRYGNQPFYLQDMRGGEGNILPARWAYCYQLAPLFGAMGSPQITTGAPPNIIFSGNRYLSIYAPTTAHMLFEGKNHYLAAFGSRTGTNSVKYRLHNKTSGWGDWINVAPKTVGAAPDLVCSKVDSQAHDFIEIGLNLTTSGTLILRHMDFSTTDYRSSESPLRHSEGVGDLKFTNTLEGELVMLRAQKIGLSVDMTEVE